ncbi:hypothetical protein AVDCRST_MAG84-3176 [uncultured Microcoleus sp.]|uniref:Uncharacterized protein n=1 Tax=uncultured Microcoleus sp. TaxID=259945 RepID=A0A6J4MEX8_9CYAN|nr:hypothetical protein AVDCRST_MAG84-3176 [uncultured Microcoleus sp.]
MGIGYNNPVALLWEPIDPLLDSRAFNVVFQLGSFLFNYLLHSLLHY